MPTRPPMHGADGFDQELETLAPGLQWPGGMRFRVRSVTLTSMIFMMPMPDEEAHPAARASRVVIILVEALAFSAI